MLNGLTADEGVGSLSGMRDTTPHIILVAFTVNGESMKDAQGVLMDSLTNIDHPSVQEWWVAEDERYDGSDNSSAIFIPDSLGQEQANAVVQHHVDWLIKEMRRNGEIT